MAANENRLGKLHEIVTDALEARLRKEDEQMQEDDLIPQAATLNAAIMFLKHNDITGTRDTTEGLDEFTKLVEQRRRKLAAAKHTPEFDS